MQLTRRTWLFAAPAGLLLLALLASGASAQVATLASPDDTPVPETEVASADLSFEDRDEALLVFAQCMRDHDIEMDDPAVGQGGRAGGFFRPSAGGFDEFGEEFQVALEACAPILEAARPELDPAAEQERLEEQLALARCLRENGYEQYPDPVLDSDGRLQRGGQRFEELGIDFRSGQFQMTRQTCAESLGFEIGPPGARGPGGN